MQLEMDRILKEDDQSLVELYNLITLAEISVPEKHKGLYNYLMVPTGSRFQLLTTLFHRAYSNKSFWNEPEKIPEDSVEPEVEIDLIKFFKVSQWFGLTNNESVLRGTAAPTEQYGFWTNLVQTVLDLEVNKYENPPLHNSKLFEELVILNTAALDELQDVYEIDETVDICNFLSDLTKSANERINEFDDKINSLTQKDPGSSSKLDDVEYQLSNAFTVSQLEEFLTGLSTTDFDTAKLTTTNFDADNISNYTNEVDQAVNSLEKFKTEIDTMKYVKERLSPLTSKSKSTEDQDCNKNE